jgi:hypothetical protein
MAFRDFSFPKVEQDLGLHLADADLFSSAPPYPVREAIAEVVHEGVQLALANSTEKAKSEFIIAPVLLELRRLAGGKIALFSGVEWEVDAARGLNGYCDFLLTRGGSEHILRAPFVAVVEAKNDLIRTGLGQCIAGMVAARLSNERTHERSGPIFGVVSTGAAWKFLRMDGDDVHLDRDEYFIDNLPKLMGILKSIADCA